MSSYPLLKVDISQLSVAERILRLLAMNYNLIIQPEAEYDIQDAFEWYESKHPGLGSEFVRAVDACLSGIGRNPLAYQVIHKQVRR